VKSIVDCCCAFGSWQQLVYYRVKQGDANRNAAWIFRNSSPALFDNSVAGRRQIGNAEIIHSPTHGPI
jgi:hypothetical protein